MQPSWSPGTWHRGDAARQMPPPAAHPAAPARVEPDAVAADLFCDVVSGPASRLPDTPASDWWLPGPARLCLITGSASVQIRKRHFASLSSVAVIGPTDRAHRVVVENGNVVSMAITPVGWARLIRRGAAGFRNMAVPLREAMREPFASLAEDLLHAPQAEGSLASRSLHDLLLPLADAAREEPMVLALDALIRDPANVQVRDLNARLGLSEAQLRSLALRHFGIPAKILLRRARFLRSLAQVDYRSGHSSYAAIDPSYHDVSHFLRDAHYFLGTTPRRFRLLSSHH